MASAVQHERASVPVFSPGTLPRISAMYGMASLLGGAPPFLGFIAIAWASLVGHVLVGLALAATAARMARSAG